MVSSSRKRLAVAVAFIGLLAVLPVIVLAGSTGQIKGRLTEAETGEPIIGASVQIVGTTRGAQTDLDGYYIIPRLDPGTYTLRISSVDHKTVEITDVEVNIDLTTEENYELEKKVTELDETITVKGTRDIIDRFEVASQVNISSETIKSQPVASQAIIGRTEIRIDTH